MQVTCSLNLCAAIKVSFVAACCSVITTITRPFGEVGNGRSQLVGQLYCAIYMRGDLPKCAPAQSG